MINRTQVESILKINGVPAGSPDEQIRSVLLSARYTKDEVDTALMVLRENTLTNKTRVDGLHKVFRTDEGLDSREISQLLGINVEVEQMPDIKEKSREIPIFQMAFVWVLSVVVAVAGILIYMYLYKIGLFHPSVGLAYFNEL